MGGGRVHLQLDALENVDQEVVHEQFPARADVAAESIRRDFPAQVTLASVEKIAKLVNEHIPGIPLQALAVAPRQIPFHAGFTYFELDRGSALFRELKAGGGVALHIPDSFPGLAMEMWAIRGSG